MPEFVEIGSIPVGEGHGVYVIAEIGLNHNGDVDFAKRLIDAAAACNAVKSRGSSRGSDPNGARRTHKSWPCIQLRYEHSRIGE
jgi:hypothetical protein